jgi:hypothetical protein
MHVISNLPANPHHVGRCRPGPGQPDLVIVNLAELAFSGAAQPTFSIADYERELLA